VEVAVEAEIGTHLGVAVGDGAGVVGAVVSRLVREQIAG
jgi:hypothetical protein